MAAEFLIAWCSCPPEAADDIARALVERRVAACVTLIPEARSTYRWQGDVEQAEETVLMIKSSAEQWPDLEAAIAELHPYDVPELIATPVSHGIGPYLDWLAEETR